MSLLIVRIIGSSTLLRFYHNLKNLVTSPNVLLFDVFQISVFFLHFNFNISYTLKRICKMMANQAAKKVAVDLFFDIVSPYSYLAFESLVRYQSIWDRMDLKLRPVFFRLLY